MLTSREESQERSIIDVLTSREESQERSIIDVLTSREKRHKPLRLPREMEVLKFIGGSKSNSTYFNLKMHEKQFSHRTNDNCSDGETQGLRIYIYKYTHI